MTKITVYPVKAGALNIKHPIDGPLQATGSDWEIDGFTARMLTDQAITKDKAKAMKAPPQAAPTAPAHKTADDKPVVKSESFVERSPKQE